jgi:hypothetical protein
MWWFIPNAAAVITEAVVVGGIIAASTLGHLAALAMRAAWRAALAASIMRRCSRWVCLRLHLGRNGA